jgi:hypothetical protein
MSGLEAAASALLVDGNNSECCWSLWRARSSPNGGQTPSDLLRPGQLQSPSHRTAPWRIGSAAG